MLLIFILGIVACLSLISAYLRSKVFALVIMALSFLFLSIAHLFDAVARICGDLGLAYVLFKLNIVLNPISLLILLYFIHLTRRGKVLFRFYIFFALFSLLEFIRSISQIDVFFSDSYIFRSELYVDIHDTSYSGFGGALLAFLVLWVLMEMLLLVSDQIQVAKSPKKRRYLSYVVVATILAFSPIVGSLFVATADIMINVSMLLIYSIGIFIFALTYTRYPYLVFLLPQRTYAACAMTSGGLLIASFVVDERFRETLPLLAGYSQQLERWDSKF